MLSKIIEVLTFGKFYLGNKKDILIFDASASAFLKNYFEVNQFNFFYSRKEKFELCIFFKTIITKGLKDFGTNYLFNYIKKFTPKYIFSMWFLNESLYLIKDKYPNIKIILIQSHFITNKNYKILSSFPKNSVDLFFTYRDLDKNNLKKIFNNTKIISIGSLKNNFYYKKVERKISNKILFFSEYKKNRGVTYDERIILKNLDEFCGINNLKLDIQTRYETLQPKYLKFLNDCKYKNISKLLCRKDYGSSYINSNIYKIIAISHSTLADEFLSNFKRVAVLNSAKDLDDDKFYQLNHGKIRENVLNNPFYTGMLPENFSWCLSLDKKIVFKVLNNVIKCNDDDWNSHLLKYNNRYLFDPNNKTFREQLRRIGIIN
tara:strand:+ start:880 stop:2004 length:1125 start_codon:yes stop_codon:yes gene_type:complete